MAPPPIQLSPISEMIGVAEAAPPIANPVAMINVKAKIFFMTVHLPYKSQAVESYTI
jgi:hypothetical protein